jgi:hypothetical protein
MGWRRGVAARDVRVVGDDRMELSYSGGGRVTVTRDPADVVFTLPEEVSPAALVHPLGTMPLSVLARWRGDMTLHGGAFVSEGGAWAVCGDRTSGKSTLLASLGDRQVPVVSDDLVVISDGDVLAGPHCVDLRAEAAERFPAAECLGKVGARVRYRLTTVAAPARTPLRGIVVLEWSEDGSVAAAPLELAERLQLVYRQQYSGLFDRPDEATVMDLLDVPMIRFRRPRSWAQMAAATDALLTAAARH